MSEPRKRAALGPGSAQGPKARSDQASCKEPQESTRSNEQAGFGVPKGSGSEEGGGAWRPVPWARLRPAGWAKVAATSSGWADARGRRPAMDGFLWALGQISQWGQMVGG